MLKAFKIKKLFGEFDVNLSFRKGANIFIGENGCGKTTILNCLYYILTSDFKKLAKINFEEIELILDKKPPIKFSKIEMLEKTENSSIGLAFQDRLNSIFKNDDIMNIKSLYEKKDEAKLQPYIDILSKNTLFPDIMIEKELKQTIRKMLIYEKIDTLKKFKDTYPIVYFPTYRRIEQDEHDLGLDADEITTRSRELMRRSSSIRRLRQNNLLIQFGMSDVEKMIDEVLNEIGRNAVKSFQDMTATLVNQYLDDKQKQKRITNLDRNNKLSTILSRIDKIPEETKNTILNLKEKELKDKQELVRLLSNLIEAYDNQKEQDDNIKNFRNVCNKYLRNKAFHYDENNLSLKILNNENKKKEIEMKDLSSGEKQIISIFSKLYLDNTNKNCVILFDEPELSISIEWQKTLITDIMNSKKCSLLIAVTHSPFIFDNEKLFKITRSMEETFKK